VSGCVGCGRCIVWCPVGIDLTEEAVALAGGRLAAPDRTAHDPVSLLDPPGGLP
jgi:sulfhydrogenase subunit beta (sulfur reductase)